MARFTLIVDLKSFDVGSVQDALIKAVPYPDAYPDADTGVIHVGAGARERTNGAGVAELDLVSLPGLQYRIEGGGLRPTLIPGDWPDGTTQNLAALESVTPSPIPAVDAAVLRTELIALIDAIEPGNPGDGPDSLVVVTGDTVILDDDSNEGTLVGYRVKTATAFQSSVGTNTLDPGVYTFERTAEGWTYYTASGTSLGGPTIVTATAPTTDDNADTYTIPTTTGAIYKVGGITKTAGTYSVGNVTATVLVTAVEAEGYELTGTTSWPLSFTATSEWSQVAADTFVGSDGASVTNRPLSGGTYTWAVDAAADGAATIASNFAVYSPAESYLPSASAYRLDPAPSAATGIVGWAWELDYVATQNASWNGAIDFRFRYQSDLYGAQNGYVALNVDNANGVTVGLGGTANDDTSMQSALAQVGGTTRPLTGRVRFEIQNRDIKFFFNDVLTYTSSLPGDLLTVQPWRWQMRNPGGNTMKVKNMVMETSA